jgi:DNA-binding transcriptional ArsR family regulator
MSNNKQKLRRDVIMSIVDEKIGKILDTIYERPKEGFYLTQLSERATVSLSSTYRILKRLKAVNLIREERIGPSKMYYLKDNEQARLLGEIIKPSKSISKLIKEFFSDILALNKIVAYGKVDADRATLLFIGDIQDTDVIEKRKKEIHQQYGLMINHIILTEDQYNKMSSLGLYPGEKKILWEKG